MKTKFLFLLSAFILYSKITLSQGGNPGNTRIPGNFLGWDGTGPSGNLQIRNDFNQQMLFGTNGFYRMIIDNGLGLQGGGRIAIGNNLPAGFSQNF